VHTVSGAESDEAGADPTTYAEVGPGDPVAAMPGSAGVTRIATIAMTVDRRT
jgi:hypothetical protein